MKIEGEKSKRIRIFRVGNDGEIIAGVVAEYDTLEEMSVFSPRRDWRYKFRVDGKYMTQAEFTEWRKTHR